MDKLGSFKYWAVFSLDMATGFHQSPMKDEDSISKTTFVTSEEYYEYLIVYQRIITKTLKRLITGKVLIYIDDVLVMSNSVSDGLETLREVLKTLTNAGFSVHLKKCMFLDTELEYLGRLVGHGQIKPSPTKTEALIKSPKPSNVREVRQFLGLAGYFKRYIAGYASKTSCIAKLLRKGEPFV